MGGGEVQRVTGGGALALSDSDAAGTPVALGGWQTGLRRVGGGGLASGAHGWRRAGERRTEDGGPARGGRRTAGARRHGGGGVQEVPAERVYTF